MLISQAHFYNHCIGTLVQSHLFRFVSANTSQNWCVFVKFNDIVTLGHYKVSMLTHIYKEKPPRKS